jgi:hypothetical protein
MDLGGSLEYQFAVVASSSEMMRNFARVVSSSPDKAIAVS